MIMRKPFVAANWKMNTNIEEALALVKSMIYSLEKIADIDKVLCPPFISLNKISDLIKNTTIKLGAQNMYFQEKGAFTGEISPLMLKNLVDYIILGHSERRQYFFESDYMINKKIRSSLKYGLIPIFCVGENGDEEESGKTSDVITRQVLTGLNNISANTSLIIAYEPVWAIGTGRPATGKQANSTIGLIRNILVNTWGENVASQIRILYGGSVTSSNIAEFSAEPEIDGALVGGASLKPDEFVSLVKTIAEIKAAK
jgi:triosephosphate isomerase